MMMKNRTAAGTMVLLAFAVALSGCAVEKTDDGQKKSEPSALTAPADYVHGSWKAGQHAKGTVGLVTIEKAVSQYQVTKGANPPSLDALVQSGLLPAIPPAPTGQKFVYDPKTGKTVLVPKP